jgi:hypothetical protein
VQLANSEIKPSVRRMDQDGFGGSVRVDHRDIFVPSIEHRGVSARIAD